MSNLTTNLNMLVPGNFKVTIDSNEFANLQFFCTTAEVPSIAQTATQQDFKNENAYFPCLLYTSPSPRDGLLSRMPSSA